MGRYNFNQRTRDGYEISPEQAARWLERNDNNRNVNVAKVKKMAKDMREGHWDTTHQGIAIASDGTLVDGQHRLLAIVESGVTVRMNVTFNAAKSQHIDSGNIRSMANRVQMSEYDMSWTNNTILSAANLIGRVFTGSNLSHEEALSECLMKYRTQIESATKCIKKATLPGLNSAGTTAAIIVAAMNDVPAIYIEKFMDVFYSGFTNNEAEHYAITLRDELLRENRVKRGTQYARFAFFRTANRLNQYYKTATGQRVAKRVNNGDFPYNVYDANGGIVKPETKNKFEARSTLGSEAVPVFDDDGELTEWLHRDNYTVEELELMNFVGNEKPVIKKDGVKIIRDGTVIRRTNTETRKTEFLFIPRIVVDEQKTV